MILTLKSPFCSAHFYYQPQWSFERNQQEFGRCFSPYGHGHNYVLEVSFEISADDGEECVPRLQKTLDTLTARLDHEHLNFMITEFKKNIPTTENIALYFLNKLQTDFPEAKVAGLRLYETDSIWTEIKVCL